MAKKIKGRKPVEPDLGWLESVITVRLPADERYQWNMLARERGQTTNSFILSVVRAAIAEQQTNTTQEQTPCEPNAHAAAS